MNKEDIVIIETKVTETITIVRKFFVDPVKKDSFSLPKKSPLKPLPVKGTLLDDFI